MGVNLRQRVGDSLGSEGGELGLSRRGRVFLAELVFVLSKGPLWWEKGIGQLFSFLIVRGRDGIIWFFERQDSLTSVVRRTHISILPRSGPPEHILPHFLLP